jgi:hypothetical protein
MMKALAQQIVVRSRHAEREFGVGGNRRPSAAHREIRIAQRGFLDRCAVPSSKVGSCDSARAAAERDSGVDAAAGLIGAACAAGLAGPERQPPVWPAFVRRFGQRPGWRRSIVAMATNCSHEWMPLECARWRGR